MELKQMKLSLFLAAFFLFFNEAHAYIDPGSGSLILQAVIGGVMGGLFAIRMYWQKVKAFFKQLKK